MTILIALVALQTPASLFDASLRAYSRLPRLSAKIQMLGVSKGHRQVETITVYSDAHVLLLRTQVPAAYGLDRIDLQYRVAGTKFDAYDAVNNEYLKRDLPPIGSPSEKLAFAIGSLEEAPGVLLQKAQMTALFSRLQKLSGWKVSSGPGVYKLVRSDRGTQSRVLVGKADHLLKELWMKQPISELHWTISYGGPSPSFAIPSSARRVSAFTLNEAPPKFESTEAKNLFERMIRASSALRSGTVIVRDANEAVRVSFDGRSLREGRSSVVWVYDGTSLLLHNGATRKFYQGKARRSDVIDLVTKLGGRVDAFTRYILLRRVPFRDVIPTGTSVAIGGMMSSNGVERTILRAVSPRRRVSLSISSDSKLPTSIHLEVLDGSKKVLSSSTRTYEYLRLNTSLPKEEFRLVRPAGTAALPLPKI